MSSDKLPELPGDRSIVNNDDLSDISLAFKQDGDKENKPLANFYDNASDDLSMIRAMENNNEKQMSNRNNYSTFSKNPQSSVADNKAFKI